MERIEKKKDVVGGRAKIKDTRIPVWTIIGYLQSGHTDEYLLENFPSITREDIRTCEQYYADHEDEINKDIADQDCDE
ncbi:MAG: DUF433 domain-containing protein [Alphaproteobacteria bacterium]